MATLNGVEFGIVHITKTIVHDNNIKDIPGSDTVVQDDLGYSTAPMRITGHVKNDNEYDDLKEQYYSGGELTLIVDPDSGRQYTVYAHQNLTDLDGDRTYPLTDIVFQAMFYMKNPYLESVTDKTRIKSITTNNQEWSADNDSADIKTDGNVDAVPDIQVTGSVSDTVLTERSGVITNNDFESALGAEWTYSEIDTNNRISGARTATAPYHGSNCYRFTSLGVVAAGDHAHISQSIDLTDVEYLVFYYSVSAYGGASSLYARMYIDSDIKSDVHATSTIAWTKVTVDTKAYTGNHTIKFQIYETSASDTNDKVEFDYVRAFYQSPTKDPEVYNTADTTVKCAVGNDILDGAIHRINVDGTGTIDFNDDFSTAKWVHTANSIGVTHDTTDDELDIADDGYIYWKCDAKYPITGIPTLTSRINITSGTPTIQISEDAATWYDIDTAIADDVETVYPLDDDGNLSLAGKTVFYWRFDCVKAAPATASIKSFKLDIDIHTIYAKNPVITKGATASTFRCDQAATSGFACDVELIFPNRWWA